MYMGTPSPIVISFSFCSYKLPQERRDGATRSEIPFKNGAIKKRGSRRKCFPACCTRVTPQMAHRAKHTVCHRQEHSKLSGLITRGAC
jgi:hypothetical protein